MAPPPQTALTLLSGGLDSSMATAMAIDQGWRFSLALTFNYGQRSAERECAQARAQAEHFHIPHRVIPLPWFKDLTEVGALLHTDEALPHPTMNELEDFDFTRRSSAAVWVPNRNGVFIEIAASFAEDLKANAIVVGFNREEAQTFPDNSLEYLSAVTTALAYSTSNKVRLYSPTATLNKTEIVHWGKHRGFPFEKLWSCYANGIRMCGRCESCVRLKRALWRNEVSTDAFFDH